MLPPSLSASAVNTFLACEARYKAEWIDRTPDMSGTAANLGTVCHQTLEEWVLDKHYLEGAPFEVMEEIFSRHYGRKFSSPERYNDGITMLRRWHERQDWDGRVVLHAEEKMRFMLPTSAGEIGFSFIFDRVDRIDHPDGTFDIEVVDYKTNIWTLAPEDLRGKVQAQAYSVAARLMFPDAKNIWVLFDFLRGDQVGLKFSVEDNRKCWDFLADTAEQILASDGSRERINAECRWCVRRHTCESLTKHAVVGGSASWTDANAAAERRAQLDAIGRAVTEQIAEIDGFIADWMDRTGVTEFSTDNVSVAISPRARRAVDYDRIVELAPPDLLKEYGGIKVTDFDKMMRDPRMPEELKPELKKAVKRNYGKPSLRYTAPDIMPD